jgi:hypothetical protein
MAAKLKLVTGAQPGIKPPRKLGQAGTNLWRAVTTEYGIVDAGGIEILALACQALDRC